jgi:hypothetical protein
VWLVILFFLIVLIAALVSLAIALMPEKFFNKPLFEVPAIVPPSPFEETPLQKVLEDQTTFLEQTHEHFTGRLRITTAVLATEAGLVTAREAERMGLDPENLRVMLELSEKLVGETDSNEFAEAVRHLSNIVKDTIAKVMAAADTTGAAGSIFIAGSLTLPVGTLVGPLLAAMVAWVSLAIAANQAAENAAQRRNILAIATLIESNTIAEFERAYEAARSHISRAADHPMALYLAQRDLNVTRGTWLIRLTETIDNAPKPFETTWLGRKGSRSTEFDNYISEGFAPVGRYLMIGVFADFFVAEKLDCLQAFSNALDLDIYHINKARAALRKRMVAEGIAAERRSGAALILRWLDERSVYLEALSQEVKLIARFSRTSTLPFKRRVRYLGLRCANEIRKRMPPRRQ